MKISHEYENFKDCYKYAYIGIPKGMGGLNKPFYGTLREFKKKYPNFSTKQKFSTVLYMHGSNGLNKGTVYRKWIVENLQFIFFAPNSFKIKNRPTYLSPTKVSDYEKVHTLRQAEIHYTLKKLKKLDFIDSNNIFLMGNSEGGFAAAIFKGKGFKARVITAFSCEQNYYSKKFKLGATKDEPFLNIIGTHDEYFSPVSKSNKNYSVKGHGIQTLLKFKKAKIVILPKTKHDLTVNNYVKADIVNFLRFWSKR